MHLMLQKIWVSSWNGSHKTWVICLRNFVFGYLCMLLLTCDTLRREKKGESVTVVTRGMDTQVESTVGCLFDWISYRLCDMWSLLLATISSRLPVLPVSYFSSHFCLTVSASIMVESTLSYQSSLLYFLTLSLLYLHCLAVLPPDMT